MSQAQSELLAGRARKLEPSGSSEPDAMANSPATNAHTEAAVAAPTGRSEPAKPRGPSYFQLFKYAQGYDKWLLVLGILGAVGDGCGPAIIGAVMNQLVNSFGSLQNDPSHMRKEVNKYATYMVYIAIGSSIATYIEVSCWVRTGERQSALLKAKYLRAILRQNVGYFDGKGTTTAEVVSNVAKDSQLVQDAMSEKAGNFLANLVQLLAAYAVGFYICWQLSFLALSLTPLVLGPALRYKKALVGFRDKMVQAYGRANVIVHESVASVRTVYSFAAEQRTVTSFVELLAGTMELGYKQGLGKGLALASTGMVYVMWAVMSWVGQALVQKGTLTGSQVVITGFLIMNSVVSLAQASANIKAFTDGAVAAHRMFQVIDRIPPIDSDDMSGTVLDKIQGHIEFRNVFFCYPSRPDVLVLNNFSLRMAAGTNVALVGSSGSGKSTVIALLERFYDYQQGEILVDDTSIRGLQLKSLRRHIGLVSQEPALFAASIKDNILLGNEDASTDDVVEAAKAANAHDFISQCPQGYDTQVGEGGVQMSGGQKQRIAIARALLRNPPILLLDEATSALDAQSEKVVQEALLKASRARTTLTVAHRLSTIRTSGSIAVMQSGVVVEMGDHDDLMAKGGVYSHLVRLQQSQPAPENFDPAATIRAADKPQLSRTISRSRSQHSRPFSRNSSLRSSSLSRSVRMLTLSGSLKRALGEIVVGKSEDWDTIIDRDVNAETAIRHDVGREAEQQKVKDVTVWRLLALNAPEWKQALLGAAGAIGYGFIHPVFAFMLGELLEALYQPSFSAQRHKVNIVGGVFLSLTVVAAVTYVTQHYFFGVMGEKLTTRVREMMLSKILSFEIGWFDREENSSGALCARLGSDAALVRTIVGDCLCVVLSIITSLVVAWTIGLVYSWRIAVVLIALQPLIITCFTVKRGFLKRFAELSAKGQLAAGQVASEAVSQVRTVAAFSAQDRVLDLFQSKLKGSLQKTARRSHIAGAGVGLIFFITYSSWSLMAWYGAKAVTQGHGSFGDYFKAFFVLAATSRVVGDRMVVLVTDLARGAQAVDSVFDILDRETSIVPDDEQAEKPTKIEGNVELQRVTFAYPERPHAIVFKGFQLRIHAGMTAALVGQSGSGKSTIVALIERFYDPLHGKVLIDGKDIRAYNLRVLRRHIGLVGQEPVLFAASIRMNIAYGKQNCSEAEIIEAAKAANAHSFISSLPEGYDTFAGARGLALSGGQKQRIAIARAVLKDPSILLLDEATSALDAESEAVVQSALDTMMVGRTTVIVAHRLSTIRNANTIAVLEDGKIVEQGSHSQLLEKGECGAYYSLVHMQIKANT